MYEPDYGLLIGNLLIVIGVAIAVFLIFRAVMLWYWKVNTVVNNQERTNELLEKLFIQMGGNENEIRYIDEDAVNNDHLLSDEEKLKKLKAEVEENELILFSIETGEYEIISKEQWNNDLRSGFAKKFKVAFDPKESIQNPEKVSKNA